MGTPFPVSSRLRAVFRHGVPFIAFLLLSTCGPDDKKTPEICGALSSHDQERIQAAVDESLANDVTISTIRRFWAGHTTAVTQAPVTAGTFTWNGTNWDWTRGAASTAERLLLFSDGQVVTIGREEFTWADTSYSMSVSIASGITFNVSTQKKGNIEGSNTYFAREGGWKIFVQTNFVEPGLHKLPPCPSVAIIMPFGSVDDSLSTVSHQQLTCISSYLLRIPKRHIRIDATIGEVTRALDFDMFSTSRPVTIDFKGKHYHSTYSVVDKYCPNLFDFLKPFNADSESFGISPGLPDLK